MSPTPTPVPTPGYDFTPTPPWHSTTHCYVPSDDGTVMLCPDVHPQLTGTSLIDAVRDMANTAPHGSLDALINPQMFTYTDAAMIATVLLVITMSVIWYRMHVHVHGARR